MARDLDAAAFIYARRGWIDSWRLQKLTYYGQAWSLAWTGRPLFTSRIEAWADGPVAPDLFRVNKYEAGPMSTDLPGANLGNLKPDDFAVLDAVIDFYGDFNKPALIEMTHAEQPWREAHQRGANSEISRSVMLRFYSRLAAIGGAGPNVPDLKHNPVDDEVFDQLVESESIRWAATLERLAR